MQTCVECHDKSTLKLKMGVDLQREHQSFQEYWTEPVWRARANFRWIFEELEIKLRILHSPPSLLGEDSHQLSLENVTYKYRCKNKSEHGYMYLRPPERRHTDCISVSLFVLLSYLFRVNFRMRHQWSLALTQSDLHIFFFSQNHCRGIQELKDQSIWWIKMLKPRSKHQYSISLLRMQLKMKKIVRIEQGYRQLWVKSIRKVDQVGFSGAWKWVNRGRVGSTLLPD